MTLKDGTKVSSNLSFSLETVWNPTKGEMGPISIGD